MTSTEKAQFIEKMPYELFEALLNVEKNAKTAYERTNAIMVGVNKQKPSDNRGFSKSTLNRNVLISLLQRNESMLTAKMVSLNIVFANQIDNPNYFNEICEVFSVEDKKTKEKIYDYQRIANAYDTSVENVKSNILFTQFKEKMNKVSNKKVHSK